MVTLHGIMAGTDATVFSIRINYLLGGLLVLFLTVFRLLTRKSRIHQVRKALFEN